MAFRVTCDLCQENIIPGDEFANIHVSPEKMQDPTVANLDEPIGYYQGVQLHAHRGCLDNRGLLSAALMEQAFKFESYDLEDLGDEDKGEVPVL